MPGDFEGIFSEEGLTPGDGEEDRSEPGPELVEGREPLVRGEFLHAGDIVAVAMHAPGIAAVGE